MSISERLIDPPPNWLSTEEVTRAIGEQALSILPEQVANADGKLTAFFRADAQELRVRAAQAGLEVVLLTPAGAELAGFSEFTADWVLPVLAAAALTVPANVAADMIYDHINGTDGDAAALVVRYREAVVDDGKVKIRVIEGPADEVARLLRERSDTTADPPASTSALPPLTEHPADDDR